MHHRFFAILIGAFLAGAGTASALVTAQQGSVVADVGTSHDVLLYVEGSKAGTTIINDKDGETSPVHEPFPTAGHKKIFLSPDQKYLAVTVSDGAHNVLTYIIDTAGNLIASPKPGSFSSWSPDSSTVLVYVSDMVNEQGTGMRIYYLDLVENYYDSGLPEGVFAAAIAPVTGDIAYSLTDKKTNRSKLYVRTRSGDHALLVNGGNRMLAWLSWSPNGSKLSFESSDLLLDAHQQKIMLIHRDGSGKQEIGPVTWAYPPIWAADGSRIAFAYDSDIWEYSLAERTLRNVTNLESGNALHPVYAEDGETILFSSDLHDIRQIYVAGNDGVQQITDGLSDKDYPVTP